MSPLTDQEFLELLPHRDGTLMEWYFVYHEVVADAEIIGCWDVDTGVWASTPTISTPIAWNTQHCASS